MSTNKYFFEHKGIFSETDFSECIALHKEDLKKKYNFKTQKLILSSVIESFHNVVKHTKNKKHQINTEYRTYLKNNYFCIETSNVVSHNRYNQLVLKIETLKKLKIAQLKQLYLQGLNAPKLKENKGARIGLILLFINSKGKVKYFIDEDGERLFKFTLIIKIKIENGKN